MPNEAQAVDALVGLVFALPFAVILACAIELGVWVWVDWRKQ